MTMARMNAALALFERFTVTKWENAQRERELRCLNEALADLLFGWIL